MAEKTENRKSTGSNGGQSAANDDRPEFQVVDRRGFTNLEDLDLSEVTEPAPRYPTFVEELMARVAETERKFEEKKEEMREETAKIRARLQADFERQLELEKQKLVLPYLDVLDNLERALSSAAGAEGGLREGIEATARLFRAALQKQGVESIPLVGQPYDPNVSEAIGVIPVSDPAQDGLVLEEVLGGYRMGELLLRPARVRVGSLA